MINSKSVSIKTRKAFELMADSSFIQTFNEDVAWNRTCERYALLDVEKPIQFNFWHELTTKEKFQIAYGIVRKQIKELFSEIEAYCG